MGQVKTVGGYFVDRENRVITSQHKVIEVEKGAMPDNFIASEKHDNSKVLRISADGERIEVVDVAAAREEMQRKYREAKNNEANT